MASNLIDEITRLRRQIDALTERNRYLEAVFASLGENARLRWRLDRQEGRVADLLLRSEGRVVAYHSLMAALWDGDEPETARAAFFNRLAKVRKKLAPDYVITTVRGTGYCLSRGLVDVDI